MGLCWPAGSKRAPAAVSAKRFSSSGVWQCADLPGVRRAVGHPDAASEACGSPPLALRAGELYKSLLPGNTQSAKVALSKAWFKLCFRG